MKKNVIKDDSNGNYGNTRKGIFISCMEKLEKNQLKNILSEKEYNEFISGEIDDIIGDLKHEGYEDKNNELKNLLLEDEKNNWTLNDFSKKIK